MKIGGVEISVGKNVKIVVRADDGADWVCERFPAEGRYKIRGYGVNGVVEEKQDREPELDPANPVKNNSGPEYDQYQRLWVKVPRDDLKTAEARSGENPLTALERKRREENDAWKRKVSMAAAMEQQTTEAPKLDLPKRDSGGLFKNPSAEEIDRLIAARCLERGMVLVPENATGKMRRAMREEIEQGYRGGGQYDFGDVRMGIVWLKVLKAAK